MDFDRLRDLPRVHETVDREDLMRMNKVVCILIGLLLGYFFSRVRAG